MKLLYVADKSSDAELAASALRGMAQNVVVLRASRFDHAAGCIDENPDLAALVVEAQVDNRSCTWFLKHVHSLGLRAPIIVIVPEAAVQRLESLRTGAYEFVARDRWLFRNLPAVVTEAIGRAARADQGRRDGPAAPRPNVAGGDGPRRSPHAPEREDARLDLALAARERLTRTLSDTQAALDRAERTHAAEQVAAADRLADYRAKLEGLLKQERMKAADLEQRLARAETALREADERHVAAMTAAARQLAECQAQYESSVAQAAASWTMVDEQLRTAAAETEQARQRHAAATVEVDRLSRRETELARAVAELTATRATLEGQLADVRAAGERAARGHQAAADQAARRQEQLTNELDRASEGRRRLEEQLGHASTARRDAEERVAAAMATAATELAARQTEFDARLNEAAGIREGLERRVRDLEASLEQARQDLESGAAAIEQLTRREAELTSTLAGATEAFQTLERRLIGTEAAFNEATERATRERLAAAKKAAEREAELDGLVQQATAARAALEQQIADVEAARREAGDLHALAMAEAARELADSRQQFEIERSDAAAAREGLERQLCETEAARDEARQQHVAACGEIEQLAGREADLTLRLADGQARGEELERQLTGAMAAVKEADERAASERAAAADRQADAEACFAEEVASREAVERELAETRSAAEESRRRFEEDAATLATRAREEAARLEGQLAFERLEHEGRLLALSGQLDEVGRERQLLDDSLGALRSQSQRLEDEHRQEREAFEKAREAARAEVDRLTGEQIEAARQFDEARTGFQQTLSRVSSEHASALATLASAVTERDQQISEQAARHSAALEAADRDRHQLEQGLQTALGARDREIEQLRKSLEAAVLEHGHTKDRLEKAQTEADRVPGLQERLDASGAEIRRQFDESPLALCRVTRGGTLTDANRAFAALAGHDSVENLLRTDVASTLFESPDELSWLVERCVATNARESIETIWRAVSGARLVVRLSASASGPDLIEMVAEDLTNLRALQNRLGQAHRMEAVGRLAAEVAVTCGNLLRDVYRDAHQWLMTVSDETARRQGETWLDEVTRATRFLQQLAAYSDEESSAHAPVELHRVLRDLEPVLKRVAGDEVEVVLELPKIASRLVVDVKAERVERLLVNLANYARQRMRLGGRLKIDVASVVVDHEFVARYPSVRRGPHALVTVTEAGRTTPAGGLLGRDGKNGQSSGGSHTEKLGVDLGALQGLIRESGGHLWMTVEPPGDMVVKVHLPLDPSQPLSQRAAARPRRGSAMARWFQH